MTLVKNEICRLVKSFEVSLSQHGVNHAKHASQSKALQVRVRGEHDSHVLYRTTILRPSFVITEIVPAVAPHITIGENASSRSTRQRRVQAE